MKLKLNLTSDLIDQASLFWKALLNNNCDAYKAIGISGGPGDASFDNLSALVKTLTESYLSPKQAIVRRQASATLHHSMESDSRETHDAEDSHIEFDIHISATLEDNHADMTMTAINSPESLLNAVALLLWYAHKRFNCCVDCKKFFVMSGHRRHYCPPKAGRVIGCSPFIAKTKGRQPQKRLSPNNQVHFKRLYRNAYAKLTRWLNKAQTLQMNHAMGKSFISFREDVRSMIEQGMDSKSDIIQQRYKLFHNDLKRIVEENELADYGL